MGEAFKDFQNQMFLVFVAGFIGLIVQIGFLFLILYGWRVFVAKFQYHMEDVTTGFFKVRDLVWAANNGAVWALQDHNPTGEAGDFSLTLGMIDGGFGGLVAQPLVVPGNYRSTHMYVVGASGSGKSSLLMNLNIQDLRSGIGLCVIDPHGDLTTALIPHLNKRRENTYLLDLADMDKALAYNPLERKPGVPVAEQVGKLILAFKRIWEDSWGARMEDILRHSLALLIEQGYTLAEFERLLSDSDFRQMLLEATTIDQTRDYFENRYNAWSPTARMVNTESSLNKVSAFLADPRIGARMSQPKSGFNVKEIMDSGGVLLVNLAKGRLAGNADLFGALLMSDIEMSFLSRKAGERKPFALYVDEFQNIATESFATVLTEARKFGLCLTMAHQSLKQLDDKLVSLILGNAQTQVYFRVARLDAERLAKESANIVAQLEEQENRMIQEQDRKLSLQEMWEVAFHNLSRLEPRRAYVMIKGAMEHPEQIKTIDNPLPKPAVFAHGEDYQAIETYEASARQRRHGIEQQVGEWLAAKKQEKRKPNQDDEGDAPPDLDFMGKS